MKNEANRLFDKAFQSLNSANKEIYRPEEDIVPFSVCKNSQYAIESFLKGYLYKKGVDPFPFKTINQLFEECKKLNVEFEKIDLSNFNCKSNEIDSRYCNNVSKVSSCYLLANNLSDFIKKLKLITN